MLGYLSKMPCPEFLEADLRRREFILFFASGALAVLSSIARAQPKRVPIIGLLGSTSADEFARILDALRARLKD